MREFSKENVVMIGDQEVCLQALENITDQRTFGEIEEDEQAQWDQIHGELREHRFDTKKEASFFVGQCIMHTCKALGANMTFIQSHGKMTQDEFEKQLYLHYKIRVSKHIKSQEDEYWQAGTYIYKEKELVAFISQAAHVQSEIVLTVPFWVVRTNVQLPGGKGVLH